MTQTPLHQIVAIVKDRKTKAKAALTAAYQMFGKEALFTGLQKSYIPLSEENGVTETLPKEVKRIQSSVNEIFNNLKSGFIENIDIVATQDYGNTKAVADLTFGTNTIKDVPATHLLFLEGVVEDLITAINATPTLDPNERWTWNSNENSWWSEISATMRTKKTKRALVLAPATDKHPAQTQLIDDDVQTHRIETIKSSGAIPLVRKNEMLQRANKLLEEIKQARQRANQTAVTQQKFGDKLFDYIFTS